MLTRLKVSLVLIPVAMAVLAGIYVYSLWAAERQRAADVPVEATGMMIRDLLAFHKKRGGFPKDLKQLEGVVWEKKQNREFSIGDRGFIHRNYFYLFTRLSPHRFTLWAVPMGQTRYEAATFFVTGTPGVYRTWKGAALSPDSVSSIKANPSKIELGTMGLVEQPNVVTRRQSE
ncbi:MAG TPA: hypothetical protein PKD24_16965 [Pyrinomonadaceae bacterium]|nr:hypothetical protein [Pyrinomonadaceae bacterium]HMP67098.1 hypothetical protein [Pyrinomonadaceae bacterium]